MMKHLRAAPAFVSAAALLLQPVMVACAHGETAQLVTTQPNPGQDVALYILDSKGQKGPNDNERRDLINRLRDKVKYVFVIFNENHSFDNEFGTFPGVNGLYSDGTKPRAAADTPGFTQTYTDVNGNQVTVQPFLIGPKQNATFVDSVDHGHSGLAIKLHVVNGQAQMDQFALDE